MAIFHFTAFRPRFWIFFQKREKEDGMGAGKKKMGGGIMFIHVNKVYRVLIHKTQPCIQLFLFLYLLDFFQFKGGGMQPP